MAGNLVSKLKVGVYRCLVFSTHSLAVCGLLLPGTMAKSSTGDTPSTTSAADPGNYGVGSSTNLLGNFGGKNPGWKDEWSKAFFTCLYKEEPSLQGKNPSKAGLVGAMIDGDYSDFGAGKPMCSDGVLGTSEAKLAALNMFQQLCIPEAAGCRQDAANLHSTGVANKEGANGIAYGLYQIGINDAKRYKCTTPDGKRITTKDQLKNGSANICCAVRIAERQHKLHPTYSLRDTMHKFWQPFGAQYKQIASGVNNACSAMAHNNIKSKFSQQEIGMASGNAIQGPPIADDTSDTGDTTYANN